MVLCKLPVPGRPTNSIRVGQVPTVLAVGVGGECFDVFFSRLSVVFSPSFWETTGFRLKYYLKEPISPNQPTNQHLGNFDTVRDNFTRLGTNINHDQTTCRGD